MTSINAIHETPLTKYTENQTTAHEGLKRLEGWENSLGHKPFACSALDNGEEALTQAHGMVAVIAALFAAGRDAKDDSGAASLIDATYAAALDGVTTLLNLSRLGIDSAEHSSSQRKAGAA